jgi:hypothetical protein
MTDSGIRDRIWRLFSILRLDSVQVDVEDGIVYLEGVVESAVHKQLLETLVRRGQGVRSVVNCLALEHTVYWPSFGSNRTRRYQTKEKLSYGYQ